MLIYKLTKELDVFVKATAFKAKVEDLLHLDLAYVPLFPIQKTLLYARYDTGYSVSKGKPLMTTQTLDTLIQSGKKYTLINARAAVQHEKNHIESAENIPHAKLRTTAQSMIRIL